MTMLDYRKNNAKVGYVGFPIINQLHYKLVYNTDKIGHNMKFKLEQACFIEPIFPYN